MNLFKLHFLMIRLELDSLRNYYTEANSALSSKRRRLRQKYQDLVDKGQEYSEFASVLEDEFHELRNIFPKYAFNFQLVALYSFIENQTIQACHCWGHDSNFEAEHQSINSIHNLDSAKEYLKKSKGVDFSAIDRVWEEINTIRSLRNRIVHHASKLNLDFSIKETTVKRGKGKNNGAYNRKVFQYVKKNENLFIDPDSNLFYIKDIRYLDYIADLSLKFFEWLTDSLSDRT